ncbi:MAG: hypothetical protein ACQEXQ_22285 [Bacillota bacterium]
METPLTVAHMTYQSTVLIWQPAIDGEGVAQYRIYQTALHSALYPET